MTNSRLFQWYTYKHKQTFPFIMIHYSTAVRCWGSKSPVYLHCSTVKMSPYAMEKYYLDQDHVNVMFTRAHQNIMENTTAT